MIKDVYEKRVYGFAELAMRYKPEIQPRSAVRVLNHWIDHYPGLRQRLESLGFRKGLRSFTPAMVEAIFEALGEP